MQKRGWLRFVPPMRGRRRRGKHFFVCPLKFDTAIFFHSNLIFRFPDNLKILQPLSCKKNWVATSYSHRSNFDITKKIADLVHFVIPRSSCASRICHRRADSVANGSGARWKHWRLTKHLNYTHTGSSQKRLPDMDKTPSSKTWR